jgi:allantoicase
MTPLTDLVSAAVGGEVVFANDDFFAAAANLVAPGAPEWREGAYTERGKWMDGWESRRRRQPGHDWCILRLGIPGLLCRLVVDTTHFRGNAPEAFGIDATGAVPSTVDDLLAPDFPWTPLIDREPLKPDHPNQFELDGGHRCTHLRLHIYPDGGVARLRALGVALPAFQEVAPTDALPDLAGLLMGGRIESVSDDFFSSPEHVLQPSPSAGMHDGWETRRRRGAGDDDPHDWLVVRLGLPGTPRSVMVDTSHFKGNAPGRISVDATAADNDQDWTEIVAPRPVQPHRQHLLDVARQLLATRVRLNLYPDGGVARFRVYGTPDDAPRRSLRLAYLNSLFPGEAERFFRTACGSSRFVRRMVAARPFMGTSQVVRAAMAALDELEREDWDEAFATHPRIGERTSSSFSSREQSGAAAAPADVQASLREGNERYEDRFGMPFIVFASGRSGEELLDVLRDRLTNDPADELGVASGEQRRITELRLRRMLCMEEST